MSEPVPEELTKQLANQLLGEKEKLLTNIYT
jgi:DNA repair protein RadC